MQAGDVFLLNCITELLDTNYITNYISFIVLCNDKVVHVLAPKNQRLLFVLKRKETKASSPVRLLLGQC